MVVQVCEITTCVILSRLYTRNHVVLSAVGMGRLNTYMAVPAYQFLAKSVDSEIITKSAVRLLKHALAGVLRGTNDSSAHPCRDELKSISCVCTMLHGFITSNQIFDTFCEAFGTKVPSPAPRRHDAFDTLTCR